MAAPSTSALDTFNAGANQLLNAPRAGWSTTLVRVADQTGTTDATPTFDGPSSTGYFSNVWNASFAANQEVWVVLAAGSEVYLYARLSALGNPTGYECAWVGGAVTIKVITANVYGTTVASGSQALSVGDSIAFVLTGTTLEAWYKAAAGSYTLICTGSDATYNISGQIGVTGRPAPAPANFDTFGGGAIVVVGGASHNLGLLGVGA